MLTHISKLTGILFFYIIYNICCIKFPNIFKIEPLKQSVILLSRFLPVRFFYTFKTDPAGCGAYFCGFRNKNFNHKLRSETIRITAKYKKKRLFIYKK